MKVLVTGHKGYIGVHLVELLKEHGYQVVGYDLNLFQGCEWSECVHPDKEIIKDIRSITHKDLDDIDCVMHLAALSNDPMGEMNANITYQINRDASIHLARISKEVGIPRFLFASSCSIYGKGVNLDLDEEAYLNPQSAYASSKIDAEKEIQSLADKHFSPAFLRNATAYGISPMFRLDLVVNNLLACAYTRGEIRMMSDGTPWRPLIHCRDIARAFVAFFQAPKDVIHNRAINVGSNQENYQVKEIAAHVQRLISNASIIFTGEVGLDPRNYRVNFDLLNKTIPNFKLEYTLEKGMDELYQNFVSKEFTLQDFEGDKYVRLRTLKKMKPLLNYDI